MENICVEAKNSLNQIFYKKCTHINFSIINGYGVMGLKKCQRKIREKNNQNSTHFDRLF